jgi:bzd-type benzoyl-CoA reductase N subunit
MDQDLKNILKKFRAVTENPGEYARGWKKEKGRPVIGYLCSYAPEEIMLAAGGLPYRIFGSGRQIRLADSHLQAYSCSLVRGAMEDVLGGHLDFLNGTVFPHTCDSIQRLSDMWRMNAGLDFHLDVVLPVKLDNEISKNYMAQVLRRFRDDLEQAVGVKITDEDIKATATLYNSLREGLRTLYAVRRKNDSLIAGSDLLAITKGSMMMDRREALDRLTEFRAGLDADEIAPANDKKRIVLAGGLCNMPDFFKIIEDSGGVIIDDDLCTGSRYVDGEIDLEGDIFEAMADRYMKRAVCPAKHTGLYSRGEHLVEQAKKGRADGVIFLYLKFCDPHAFDYPYIKTMLDAQGIPNLLLELEDSSPSEGQFRTRCEAFIEML